MLDKIEMLLTSYDLEMYTTKLLLEKVLIYIESQIQGKEQRGKALLKAALPAAGLSFVHVLLYRS